MIKQIIFLLLVVTMVAGCFGGEKVIVEAEGMGSESVAIESRRASIESTKVCCDLTGNYTYSGKGLVRVEQSGSDVHIYMTWTPRGKGPHYEVKGILVGNTIKGKWYSHISRQGWYDFTGVVSPSGKMIDLSQTQDPIRSNLNKLVLINNTLLREPGIGFIEAGKVDNYMNTQEIQLRGKLRGSGIDVVRVSKHIILKLPDNITFATGSDALKPKFTSVLGSIASVLKEFDSTLVTTIGHTDNVGVVENNQKLSEKRAKSLSDYLTANGISKNRLTAIGKGQFQPIASNKTSHGRALNRRVEIMLEALQQ